MVYAKFGGQTDCIMGNWKIENGKPGNRGNNGVRANKENKKNRGNRGRGGTRRTGGKGNKTVNSLRIFRVTGANQNARKFLVSDLVNTNNI